MATNMGNPNQGLLGLLLQNLNVRGVELQPKLEGQEIIVELNKEQVKQIAFQGLPPSQREIIDLELHEGKMILKIKLF